MFFSFYTLHINVLLYRIAALLLNLFLISQLCFIGVSSVALAQSTGESLTLLNTSWIGNPLSGEARYSGIVPPHIKVAGTIPLSDPEGSMNTNFMAFALSDSGVGVGTRNFEESHQIHAFSLPNRTSQFLLKRNFLNRLLPIEGYSIAVNDKYIFIAGADPFIKIKDRLSDQSYSSFTVGRLRYDLPNAYNVDTDSNNGMYWSDAWRFLINFPTRSSLTFLAKGGGFNDYLTQQYSLNPTSQPPVLPTMPQDGSISIMQDLSKTLWDKAITGLALDGAPNNEKLYASWARSRRSSSNDGDKVLIYDANTLNQLNSFNFTNPGRLKVINNTAWIIQNKDIFNILSTNDFDLHLSGISVVKYDIENQRELLRINIPDWKPADIAIDRSVTPYRVLVADNNSNQILVFNSDGQLISKIGKIGGVYNPTVSTEAGYTYENRFAYFKGIGVSSTGDLAVAHDGEGFPTFTTIDWYKKIADSNYSLQSRLGGNTFGSVYVADPSNPTISHIGNTAIQFNPLSPSGQNWAPIGATSDSKKYPHSIQLRKDVGGRSPSVASIRTIGGEKFIFYGGQGTIAWNRLDSGLISKPNGAIIIRNIGAEAPFYNTTTKSWDPKHWPPQDFDSSSAPKEAYHGQFWFDKIDSRTKLGDYQMERSEYTPLNIRGMFSLAEGVPTFGNGVDYLVGGSVADLNGDIWLVGRVRAQINNCPTYTDDTYFFRFTAKINSSKNSLTYNTTPTIFKVPAGLLSIGRFDYDPKTDSLYMLGAPREEVNSLHQQVCARLISSVTPEIKLYKIANFTSLSPVVAWSRVLGKTQVFMPPSKDDYVTFSLPVVTDNLPKRFSHKHIVIGKDLGPTLIVSSNDGSSITEVPHNTCGASEIDNSIGLMSEYVRGSNGETLLTIKRECIFWGHNATAVLAVR